jgi:hypothetical protein
MGVRRITLVLVLLMGLIVGSALATVRRVPGESTTIQAALDASIQGDTVLVAAGTFTGSGNRDLNYHGRDIVLRSESGPEATIINAEGSPSRVHRAIWFVTGESRAAILEGFTLRGGFEEDGSAVFCSGTASPTIRNCIITQNQATGYGYADGVLCTESSAPLFVDCVITENLIVGGLAFRDTSHPLLLRCAISNNRRGIYCDGQAVVALDGCLITGNFGYAGIRGMGQAVLDAVECEIVLNGGDYIAGGINWDSYGGALHLVSCTIANNRSYEGNVGGISGLGCSEVTIEKTVIWGNWGASCVLQEDEMDFLCPSVRLTCCALDEVGVVVYGGTVVVYDGEQVHSDPLFCKAVVCGVTGGEGNYSLAAGSPCLPGVSPCGELIGARGEGCPPTSAKKATWGQIKALFK